MDDLIDAAGRVVERGTASDGEVYTIPGAAVTLPAGVPAARALGLLAMIGEAPPGPAPAPVVPDMITNAQGQAALRLSILPDGISRRTRAEELIRAGVQATRELAESHPDRIRADLALIGWEQTNEWRRSGTTVAAIAGQLNWSGAEVDALFIAAAGIDL